MLSHRARRILLAAVGDFIASGEPVASRTLARLHDLELSPATVRAVFAELEAGGYLTKPHASAGRVPTD
ncbi:MAG: heat-inducible transcriptional repressor HrcA, partial [Rhodoglobus sp.]|nr:heat-inducible transcriptional repressor HrcA [Rhodoglobus sp.]